MNTPALILTVSVCFWSQLLLGQSAAPGKPAKAALDAKANVSPWGPIVETNFPFFSSVLDARTLGAGWPTNNLTPRGLILNLGNDCWACFDVDLLRVSAIWQGKGITPVGMAQGSYHVPGAKAPEGQKKLPEIVGTPWIANGIYPGWQSTSHFRQEDPRDPGRDPREVGRGPLPLTEGRFKGVQLFSEGVRLDYEARGTAIREWVTSRSVAGEARIQRRFEIAPHTEALTLVLGSRPQEAAEALRIQVPGENGKLLQTNGVWLVQVPPSKAQRDLVVTMGFTNQPTGWKAGANAEMQRRWPQHVVTVPKLSQVDEAFVVDEIPVPSSNPWKRNIRLADVAFRKNGEAFAVTFDGDVWQISGLAKEPSKVTWQRFASGLHEPLGIVVRNEEVYVFDRNGIWCLRDTDRNGEADFHELFSNAFAQTAETREYANGIRLAPDGSFIIAKGGQQGTTLGRDNGTVLRIAPDGKSAEVVGWGLRQPFIGVDPKTGLITASDQQGHYTPATPLQIIEGRKYYGYLTGIEPKEVYPAPIADPLTWIPHPINASGAGQVWLRDAKLGPLNDQLIHIGYYRPELFLVLMNQRSGRPQAAVVSVTRNFSFPPFAGAVNPQDGLLYVAGFQIWGTQAEQISGLGRLRYTGKADTLPREIVPTRQGILLRFGQPLDKATATALNNFSIERWSYKRSAEYGSPHFKTDGSKGQDTLFASSAYLSNDRKAVFIGIPDMQPVMQMRFGWALRTEQGTSFQQNAYFTPYDLPAFEPLREGFSPVEVDLTAKAENHSVEKTAVSAEEGKRVAELIGCVACHSTDGSVLGKVGPSWKGLFGSNRPLTAGKKVTADETYLKESILLPSAKIVVGFDKADTGMPSYDGVISDAQLESVILYIKSLK